MMDRDMGAGCALGRSDDWRPTIVYGLAHFGKSLFWYAGELLFAYFLTEVTGLGGLRMGMVLAIGLTFSAMLDPIVGLVARRTLADPGRSIRLQLVGSLSSAGALMALFMGTWMPSDHRLLYSIAAGVAFRCAYALYDLPQNALISLATGDAEARTRVTSVRLAFSGLAALAIATAIGPLAMAQTTTAGAGLPLLAVGCGLSAVAITTAFLLSATVRPTGRPSSVSDGIRVALPRDCRPLLALAFVMSVTLPLFAKLQPYLATYALRAGFWGGAIGCAVPIGSMLSQLMWSALSAQRSRRRIVRLSCGVIGVAGLAFWYAMPSFPVAAVLAALAFGWGSSGLAMSVWAAFGDALAEAPGREGWGFGLLTASLKLGLGAGGLVLGAVLGSIDFRAADNMVLPAAMAGAAIGGAVACLALVALWHPAPGQPADVLYD